MSPVSSCSACGWQHSHSRRRSRPQARRPSRRRERRRRSRIRVSRSNAARFASPRNAASVTAATPLAERADPDLTRSTLVAEDVRGNKIAPIVRQGRTEKRMPAITVSEADLTAIVACIHDAKTKAEPLDGGRRSVDAEDLETGNAEAGRQYFNGPGSCTGCHSISGTVATVGSRYKGLALLQRMLYPGSGRDAGSRPPATATITTRDDKTVSGQGDLPRRVHDHDDGCGRVDAVVAGRRRQSDVIGGAAGFEPGM